MAIRAGRVGVRPDQVDPHGRLKATDWLVDKLRELINSNDAEIHANQLARLEIERLNLDNEIVQKPIVNPVKPIAETENLEEVEHES